MEKPKHLFKKLSRSKILSMARLQYLCNLVGDLPIGEDTAGFIWKGDFQNGEYQYFDGLGNSLLIHWNSKDLALTVFDHESSRGESTEESVPAWVGMGRVSETSSKVDSKATAWLWAEGESVYLAEPFDSALEHGLWMVENYVLSFEQAVIEGNDVSQPWFEIYSLSAEQQDLVVWLAEELETSPSVKLTKDQWQDLLTLDSSWADHLTGLLKPLENESIQNLKKRLEVLNIFILL